MERHSFPLYDSTYDNPVKILNFEEFIQQQPSICINYDVIKKAKPSSPKERTELIIAALHLSNINLEQQKQMMILFKDMWAYIYQHSNFIEWLGQEPSKVNQCCKYVSDKNQQGIIKHTTAWQPLNDKEAYLALVAQVHLNELLDEAKTKEWLAKMKNAWNKKNSRDKSKANKKKTPTPA